MALGQFNFDNLDDFKVIFETLNGTVTPVLSRLKVVWINTVESDTASLNLVRQFL